MKLKSIKPKKCKVCPNKFMPYNSLQKVCSVACSVKLAKILNEKEKVIQEKIARKEHQEARKEANDFYKKKLQVKVQLIARLIDHGQPCTAKGFINTKMDGGHLISRAAGSNMKYNLHNIFIQSAQSNHWQNDDYFLREGVKAIFGQDYYDFIISLQSTPITKYTNEEYKVIYNTSLEIVKELKKNLYVRTTDERIELRNKYNLQLNIYEQKFSVFQKEPIS